MALGIVDITEHDGFGGTGLLACGHDFTVSNRAVLSFRGNLSLANPLHAVSAFFHDPARAHRNVGVAQQL